MYLFTENKNKKNLKYLIFIYNYVTEESNIFKNYVKSCLPPFTKEQKALTVTVY